LYVRQSNLIWPSLRGARRDKGDATAKALQAEKDEDDEDDEDALYGADVEGDVEELEIDPGDEEALQMFMFNKQPQQARNLGDIILEKIREKEQLTAAQSAMTAEDAVKARLNPKVAEVYSQYVL